MPVHASTLRNLLVGLILAALFWPAQPARAKAQIVGYDVEYTFGGQIQFLVRIQSDSPITSAWLNIQLQNNPVPVTLEISPGTNGQVQYALDPNSISMRAFSNVKYWYRLSFEDGTSQETEPAIFYYEDNRFTWQRLESGVFRLNWYSGDTEFANNVLDISNESLQKIQELLPVQAPDLVNIYIYPNSAEMQTTLLLSGQSWVAGHADPDLAVMVVALPPGPEQRLEARRIIPHELMHILLYQTISEGYHKLPAWLNEGMASLAELTPNPEYQKILDEQNDSLIPLNALCSSFPPDSRGAGLSYAESSSFIRYLYRRFGSLGLQSLVQSYATGADCETAPQAALGASLSVLDAQWQQDTSTPNAEIQQPQSAQEAGPWTLLLGAVVVIPILLASVSLLRKPVKA